MYDAFDMREGTGKLGKIKMDSITTVTVLMFFGSVSKSLYKTLVTIEP